MRDIRRPCKNKDLAARNGKLLFTRDQIPESDYFKELELFEQNRIRLFNELDPVESRLHIPGKIIHLVHDMDRSGKYKNKYIPYWEKIRIPNAAFGSAPNNVKSKLFAQYSSKSLDVSLSN